MSREAIILAGGFGTRLQAVVSDVPKPMAPVAGRPFLSYLLETLYRFKYDHVVLSVGYKSQVIKDYFGPAYKSIQLSYCAERDALGTGGGIRLASDYMDSDSFLILNGDTYFDLDLHAFESFHASGKFDLSVALRSVDDAGRYGSVQVDGDRIIGFAEKSGNVQSGLINGGVYQAHKDLIMTIPEGIKCSFETEILQREYRTKRFGGWVQEGYFIDIGIPEDYERANVEFGELFGRR